MRILLAAFCAAIPLLASPITLTHFSDPNRLFLRTTVTVNGETRTVNAGHIGVLFNEDSPAFVFCADPAVWLRSGPVAVNPISLQSFNDGGRLAWLYHTYNPTLTAGWQAAALQVAIWEVIMDNDDNLGSGAFRYSAGTNAQVFGLANDFLMASAGQSSTGVTFYVPEAGATYSQTLMGASIPEPASFVLTGLGLYLIHRFKRGTTTSCV